MCGNDYSEFSSSIKTLKEALALPYNESPDWLTVRNSSIETFWDVSTDSEINNFDNKSYFYFRMMGVNKFNSFLYNLNQVSLIQKGLDEGYPKPVREIYNAIINILRQPVY
jgi:hypothetical protein